MTTVTDTGSTTLNYVKAFFDHWENVLRFFVNGVLGRLTDLNQTLEQNGIYPQAIPLESAPMFVAESLQYLMGRAGQLFSSFAISPNSPTWWFMGAGGMGGGSRLGSLPSTAVEFELGPLAEEAIPSAAGRAATLLQIANPHFTPTKTEAVVFQSFAERVAAQLQANPSLFSSYLSAGEQGFTARGFWAERIKFGNAVERAMADASAPSGLLIHTGEIRPFTLGGADFVGAPGSPLEGLRFQVTSVAGFEWHFLNSPEGTIFGIYPPYARPPPSP
jgi:hypothetical protein